MQLITIEKITQEAYALVDGNNDLAVKIVQAYKLPFQTTVKIFEEFNTLNLPANPAEMTANQRQVVKNNFEKQIVSCRTGLEKRRKELKEQSLKECRAIDGVAKKIEEGIMKLEAEIKAISRYEEQEARLKIEALFNERIADLKAKGLDKYTNIIPPKTLAAIGEHSEGMYKGLVAELEAEKVKQQTEEENKRLAAEAKALEMERQQKIYDARIANITEAAVISYHYKGRESLSNLSDADFDAYLETLQAQKKAADDAAAAKAKAEQEAKELKAKLEAIYDARIVKITEAAVISYHSKGRESLSNLSDADFDAYLETLQAQKKAADDAAAAKAKAEQEAKELKAKLEAIYDARIAKITEAAVISYHSKGRESLTNLSDADFDAYLASLQAQKKAADDAAAAKAKAEADAKAKLEAKLKAQEAEASRHKQDIANIPKYRELVSICVDISNSGGVLSENNLYKINAILRYLEEDAKV